MTNSFLELKNVSYKIKNNLILNKVNFKINSGEKIALIGKSGSGKTTLLSILNGSISPSSGEFKFINKEFQKLDFIHKRKLTMIWQDLRLIEGLSSEQNVNCGLLGQKNFLFAFKNLLNISSFEEAHQYMKLCRITKDIYPKNIKEISGGQKQRVAIARSLIQKSDILLADEPFNNLDPKLAINIKNLIISNKRNFPKTVLVAHHRLDLLDGFDRVIGLNDGQIIFDLERIKLKNYHLKKIY